MISLKHRVALIQGCQINLHFIALELTGRQTIAEALQLIPAVGWGIYYNIL